MNARARVRLLAAAVTAAGLSSVPAIAATQTSTFQVTATVEPGCLIEAAENMAFGVYDGHQRDAKSAISVICTRKSPYDIGLDAGTSQGATVTTRKMTGPGGDVLAYGLFTDAGRTINWGNTVGVDTVHGTGDGRTQRYSVFGRVAAAQGAAAGEYTDTITVTLTF